MAAPLRPKSIPDVTRTIHAFSVDVEDWYHGIPVAAETKRTAERRLHVGLERLLPLLAAHHVTATFFVLGPVAVEHPALVRRIADAGHEIGCHGWSHDLLYTMAPGRFKDETARAQQEIARITGCPVVGYRAAYFSVTSASLWALDILAELGFKYDSSIFPVKNWRYGIEDYEPYPSRVSTPSGQILEFPMSIRHLCGRTLPLTGGAYFRLYPYAVTRANLRSAEQLRRPAVFYLHPWELDPEHPRVPFARRPHFTHYFQLGSMLPRLRRLLNDFQFASVAQVLDYELTRTRP